MPSQATRVQLLCEAIADAGHGGAVNASILERAARRDLTATRVDPYPADVVAEMGHGERWVAQIGDVVLAIVGHSTVPERLESHMRSAYQRLAARHPLLTVVSSDDIDAEVLRVALRHVSDVKSAHPQLLSHTRITKLELRAVSGRPLFIGGRTGVPASGRHAAIMALVRGRRDRRRDGLHAELARLEQLCLDALHAEPEAWSIVFETIGELAHDAAELLLAGQSSGYVSRLGLLAGTYNRCLGHRGRWLGGLQKRVLEVSLGDTPSSDVLDRIDQVLHLTHLHFEHCWELAS